MDYQLEAIGLLTELSLPDGYRVRTVEGRLYLFDPQGIPLHGPKDPALLEAYAWRHAWRRIERELNEELVDFHTGVRPLHRLRRLRQYMKMLDAVRQLPGELEERRARRAMVAWGAVTASAAAAAAVLLITPLRTVLIPERTPHSAKSSQPAAASLAKHPAPALPGEPSASGNVRVPTTTGAGEMSRRAVGATSTGPRRPARPRYAVSFGEFFDHSNAVAMMHIIRSKGYIVYVARIGEAFQVVTRPYHTRAQAERLANALQEIGLPAQLATAARSQALSAEAFRHSSSEP